MIKMIIEKSFVMFLFSSRSTLHKFTGTALVHHHNERKRIETNSKQSNFIECYITFKSTSSSVGPTEKLKLLNLSIYEEFFFCCAFVLIFVFIVCLSSFEKKNRKN